MEAVMALKRFGVSLESELLDELDRYTVENGFANRSRAVRALIEKYVTEENGRAIISWRVRCWYSATGTGRMSRPG